MRRSDHAALHALAEGHLWLLTHATAGAAGVTSATLRWAVESGHLHRVSAGVFTPTEHWLTLSDRGRHRLILLAAQLRSPGSVACGLSAAVAWRLPIPEIGTPTMMSAGRKGHRAGVRWRRLTVTRAHRVGGLMVTTPARTVVDCARHLDLPWGLAVADAALHLKLVTAPELAAELATSAPTSGLGAARWVVQRALPTPESPLESLGRADIELAELRAPEPQPWLRTERRWARVDLLDRVNRVVTEADGKVKYEGMPAVWEEKLREDDIRDLQIEVVRFTMYDHHHQSAWLARYRRALTRGKRSAAEVGPVPWCPPPKWLP